MAAFDYACECNVKGCRLKVRMDQAKFAAVTSSTRRMVHRDCADAFVARRRGECIGSTHDGHVILAARLGPMAVAA